MSDRAITTVSDEALRKLRDYADADWHRDQYFSSKVISAVADHLLDARAEVARLKAELEDALKENYADDLNCTMDRALGAERECDQLRAQLATAREALEHIACRACPDFSNRLDDHLADVARAALAQMDGEGNEEGTPQAGPHST